MKCISCGKEIPNGNVYCPICGKEAQIISDKIVLEDDLLKVLIETEGTEAERLAYEEEQRMLAEKELRKKKKQALLKKKQKQQKIIVLLIIVVCIVAVCLIFGVRKSSSFDHLYDKAEVAYHTGKYDEALDYAVKALDKNPEAYEIYLLMGDTYVQMEKLDMAHNCYMKVIDMKPTNITSYEKLLKLYANSNEYEAIETLYSTIPQENEELLKLFDSYLVAMPEISIPSGEYDEVLEIRITGKKGLSIYYTLDGTTPSDEKTLYEKPIQLKEEGKTILKAICVDEQGNASNVVQATYDLEFAVPDKPVVSPDGGTFTSKTTVTIYVEEGTSVYYTWDGTTPSKKSSKYESPLPIPEGNNILSVIAVNNNTGETSEVFKTNFIYYPEVVETE